MRKVHKLHVELLVDAETIPEAKGLVYIKLGDPARIHIVHVHCLTPNIEDCFTQSGECYWDEEDEAA